MQIEKLKQDKDLARQIGGEIFAVEGFGRRSGSDSSQFITQYSKGVDTWHKDEQSEHSWIANGNNDTIPYLHRLIYRKSGIHNSAVNIKGDLIFGDGLEFVPLEDFYKKNADGFYDLVEVGEVSELAETQLQRQVRTFDKNAGLSLYFKRAAHQIALYGGYYGFRNYFADSSASVRIRKLHIEPYHNMRMGSKRKFGENDFESLRHYISDDFTEVYNMRKVLSYKEFAQGKRLFKKGNLAWIPVDNGMVRQEGRPGVYSKFCGRQTMYRDFYATPDYETLDALTYMDIDHMLSQKDFKDLESGFSLDSIIIRYRSPKATASEEAAQKKKDKEFIQKNYRGAGGEKNLMMWVSPSVDDSGKVQAFDPIKIIEVPHNNNIERYNVLREERMLKILNAHNIVTGEIIGLPRLSSTGFSSQADFLITAAEQLHHAVIKPYQEIILEDIQQILIDEGIPVKPVIKQSSVNYRVLTENLINWSMTLNELRGSYKLPELEDDIGDKILSQITKSSNTNNNSNDGQNNSNNPPTKEDENNN